MCYPAVFVFFYTPCKYVCDLRAVVSFCLCLVIKFLFLVQAAITITTYVLFVCLLSRIRIGLTGFVLVFVQVLIAPFLNGGF